MFNAKRAMPRRTKTLPTRKVGRRKSKLTRAQINSAANEAGAEVMAAWTRWPPPEFLAALAREFAAGEISYERLAKICDYWRKTFVRKVWEKVKKETR